jgi:hypothetical protein
MNKRRIQVLTVLSALALPMLPTSGVGPDRVLADDAMQVDDQPAALPRRPLPPDMVEGFGEGRVLAFHYQLSYFCPTTPHSDLDGPFGHGDGHPQAEDPKEYQVPTCFVGDTGTGSILPAGVRPADSPPIRKLYGILPSFDGGSLLFSNNAATDVQTQCSQPGPPFTQYKGPVGTCLMHPSMLRVAPNTDDPPFPDPTPMAQHSHVIEGTNHPAGWWNVVGVTIKDRSIWPDNNGNCPAGRPACVTSLAALRAAQTRGQASPDIPSNLYFFYSVAPVENAE